MKQIGKISIVLPCYKAEKYVAAMVDDIKVQSYTDWELIIVSNGADQEAQNEVLAPYLYVDNRIKLIKTLKGGVSHARNLGVAEASGDWLTFVDADDRLEPAHLEALVAGVRDDVDMVVGGFTQIKVKDNIRTMCRIKEDMAFGREYLKRDNLIIGICCNKLFRMCKIREWGGAFDERQTYAEDAVYSLSFLLQTQKMNTVAMTGYQYLCRDENSANDKYQACIVDAYQRMTDLVATLMEKAKCSEKEIVIYRLGQAYYTSYFGVCNLFKKGCPLSFREKVRETENEKGDDCHERRRRFERCGMADEAGRI